jgi:hypothetical protein
MKVFLLDPKQIQPEITAHQRGCYEQILASVAMDFRQEHQLSLDTGEADLILAPIQGGGYGLFFQDLRKSEFFHRHRKKLLIYSPDDLVYPLIPGIFSSASRLSAELGWACGAHYVSNHIHQHQFNPAPLLPERDLLFSFLGSTKTHPIREKLLDLKHSRGFIFDSMPRKSQQCWWEQDSNSVSALFQQFKTILERTKFALCPRGISASTIRLFEAMEAGCVPVVISDQLVLPMGPEWSSFCVQIPEHKIASIPTVLQKLEPSFAVMSQQSRIAWENYFSPQATFHTLVESGRKLLQISSPQREILGILFQAGEYLTPRNFRAHLRSLWIASRE